MRRVTLLPDGRLDVPVSQHDPGGTIWEGRKVLAPGDADFDVWMEAYRAYAAAEGPTSDHQKQTDKEERT